MSNRAIADAHGISINTVKSQISSLLMALGLESRYEIHRAFDAARRRADAGATRSELLEYLHTWLLE